MMSRRGEAPGEAKRTSECIPLDVSAARGHCLLLKIFLFMLQPLAPYQLISSTLLQKQAFYPQKNRSGVISAHLRRRWIQILSYEVPEDDWKYPCD